MSQRNLVLKVIRRVSPSRYTAMQSCLLRECWTAAGNGSLLPPSSLAELGTVIHRFLEAAGRGQLGSGQDERIDSTWNELVAEAEERMALSVLSRHLVPLSRSVPDYQVRKLRAVRKANEIALDSIQTQTASHVASVHTMEHEVWVESSDGKVGGFIDRVNRTKDGAVLSDYKSGAILDSARDGSGDELKQTYKIQLELYAALYHSQYGSWPIRLEVVPLQGTALDVVWDPTSAEALLAEASTFLTASNDRIAGVQTGDAMASTLASAHPASCRACLYRPACKAYWIARSKSTAKEWPSDVRGSLREVTHLRNGKVCIKITGSDSAAGASITVRDLSDDVLRHPVLRSMATGEGVAIYGLRHDGRSGDFLETPNTVICEVD